MRDLRQPFLCSGSLLQLAFLLDEVQNRSFRPLYHVSSPLRVEARAVSCATLSIDVFHDLVTPDRLLQLLCLLAVLSSLRSMICCSFDLVLSLSMTKHGIYVRRRKEAESRSNYR
jgi:hypothetical protein